MSTPQRYQPTTRLIDNPQELRRLYVHEDKTIREIAAQSDWSSTPIYEALVEYGILDDEPDTTDEAYVDEHDSRRGRHPPADDSEVHVDWSSLPT